MTIGRGLGRTRHQIPDGRRQSELGVRDTDQLRGSRDRGNSYYDRRNHGIRGIR